MVRCFSPSNVEGLMGLAEEPANKSLISAATCAQLRPRESRSDWRAPNKPLRSKSRARIDMLHIAEAAHAVREWKAESILLADARLALPHGFGQPLPGSNVCSTSVSSRRVWATRDRVA